MDYVDFINKETRAELSQALPSSQTWWLCFITNDVNIGCCEILGGWRFPAFTRWFISNKHCKRQSHHQSSDTWDQLSRARPQNCDCETSFYDIVEFPFSFTATDNHNRINVISISGVIGCIDGTQVITTKPSSLDDDAYRCRKKFLSINVEAVVSHDLTFSNILAR